MKKIIGILGVAMLALVMFFSANNVNNFKSDTSLTSVMEMNVANAQIEIDIPINTDDCVCKGPTCQDSNWISFRPGCGDVPGPGNDTACRVEGSC